MSEKTINKICEHIDIQDHIKKEAEKTYTDYIDAKNNKTGSMNRETIAASALYVVCKINSVNPRTISDISSVTNTDPNKLAKYSKLIKRELNIKPIVRDPKEYLDRYCIDLEMPERCKDRAKIILDTINQDMHIELSNTSPNLLAVGALYISGILCSERRTQREFADACNVTIASVRKVYSKMADALPIEIIF